MLPHSYQLSLKMVASYSHHCTAIVAGCGFKLSFRTVVTVSRHSLIQYGHHRTVTVTDDRYHCIKTDVTVWIAICVDSLLVQRLLYLNSRPEQLLL